MSRSNYPAAPDTEWDMLHNDVDGAVVAIETELGLTPSAAYDTVGDRLSGIEGGLDGLETALDQAIIAGLPSVIDCGAP